MSGVINMWLSSLSVIPLGFTDLMESSGHEVVQTMLRAIVEKDKKAEQAQIYTYVQTICDNKEIYYFLLCQYVIWQGAPCRRIILC